MTRYILAIDQGTTSSRAIIFNESGEVLSQAQQEFEQLFPANGHVEHRPKDIWQTCLDVSLAAINQQSLTPSDIGCIGISNQRETTLVWEKTSGEPVYNAIVWQDRRTAEMCNQLKLQGHETLVQSKTGLLLDPYFSATKLAWILDNVPGARRRAEQGELLFGTVDTYLLWQLTRGRSHKTDATNASRTMLYNIHNGDWDQELLDLFRIPSIMLPQVCDCSAEFGSAVALGADIPITGIAGDQQAALFGQACFKPGMVKSTYGTGCFMILNTGEQPLQSRHRLLTTVAYQLQGKTCYGIEGSIFIAGAAIQWLRDGLKLINNAQQTQALAENANPDTDVYMVPAFTGLGAPYWDPDARGALLGLTRDTGIEDIVAAGLLSVCYQTRDLLEAMNKDGADLPQTLRVDGGMVANGWFVQALANTLNCRVQIPATAETTALGAAYLAGLHLGIFTSLSDIENLWHCEHNYYCDDDHNLWKKRYCGWLDAVEKVKSTPDAAL